MAMTLRRSKPRVVLLDVDGVLLDNAQMDQEWTRLAGSAFCPVLGGRAEAWLEHQAAVWQRVWQQACREDTGSLGLRGMNLARWWDRVHAEWIAQTCAAVGVVPPATFEERVDAAERVFAYFLLHTEAVVPGAAAAIRSLSPAFEIHMASGNPSWIVEKVLERLGVSNVVGRPFGSDLVGVQKGNERFYPTILEQVGVPGEDTLLVDDADGSLANAAKWGIGTVKVSDSSVLTPGLAIPTLADLPRLLESFN